MESKYSAAMPDAAFVLPETKTIARLMMDSNDRESIRAEIHDGNLLNVKTLSNEEKIFSFTYRRLDLISDDLKNIIIKGEDSDARFVNLISIMRLDLLFREFVFEVYSECLFRRDPVTDYQIMSFFQRKGREDDTVGSWRDSTLSKMRTRYARILYSAGLVKKPVGIREVSTPYVTSITLDLLRREGFSEYIKATLGIL